MDGEFVESTDSASPDEAKIREWALYERAYFGETLKKRSELEEEGSGSRLNDLLFTKFSGLCAKYGVTSDPRILAGLLPSVRSALGNSCERLLGFYGAHAVKIGRRGELHGSDKDQTNGAEAQTASTTAGVLQAYILGADFKCAVQTLRQALAEAQKRAAKQQKTAVRTGQSSLLLMNPVEDPATAVKNAIEKTAKDFFVQVNTVRDLVHHPKKKISYPDSVSIFEKEVRVAQHKLSGETDVNNTEANVQHLIEQCSMFAHLDRKVAAIAVLPFSKHGVSARWVRELNRQIAADPLVPTLETAVYTDADVFRGLFGECPDAEKEYEMFLGRIASVGANRLFHAFAPPHLTTDGLTWEKVGNGADAAEHPTSRTYVITVPVDIPTGEIEAVLDLVRLTGATAETF